MLKRLLSIALGEVPAEPVEYLSGFAMPPQERHSRPSALRPLQKRDGAGERRNPFAAVSIVPARTCCRASTKLLKQRFLTREAPLLPLKDCTLSEQCQCRYQKHEDRRKQRGRRATDR
jgi:hypothetical protein